MSAIVFDLDGTLIDSLPDLHAAGAKMLDSIGVEPVSVAQTRSFIGNGIPVLVGRILDAVDVDPARKPELLASFRGFYAADSVTETRLYPGVEATLDALRAQGHQLGLCTNKPIEPTQDILRHFGIDRHFQAVIGGDSLNQRKPSPEPLWATFDMLGGADRYFVGDSEVDAETALNASVPFLMFTEGYRKTPIAELPHSAAFDDFRLLQGLISARAA
ncbi:phosphoglycolate phosphatase [Qingshengfaniella alkalisoli]|uniref:phosphoglycolate phosphatase n=1 Tax=Qingshengfaniella alkalisoli TaxID=2599296 RepID=UPI001F0D2B17|nr:phosphoglycolate phosphatase [Qingshengfaniella alkalisoli]